MIGQVPEIRVLEAICSNGVDEVLTWLSSFFPQKHFSIFDYFSNGECQETENVKIFLEKNEDKPFFNLSSIHFSD